MIIFYSLEKMNRVGGAGTNFEIDIDDNVLKGITENNSWETARGIAVRMKITHATIIHRLTRIGGVKKVNKWVPCELSDI